MIFSFEELGKSGNRESYTMMERLKYGSIAIAILASFVLYAFELPYFDHYTDFSLFLKIALISGVLLGIGLGFYFKKRAEDATEVMQVFTMCILACAIFFPLIFSLINRSITLDSYQREVQIIKIDKRYTARFGKIDKGESVTNRLVIHYLDKGKSYSYTTEDMSYIDLQRGDEVKLFFKKGLLGFEYSAQDLDK